MEDTTSDDAAAEGARANPVSVEEAAVTTVIMVDAGGAAEAIAE